MTEDDSNDEKSGTELCERFADKESCATARARELVGAITGSADQ